MFFEKHGFTRTDDVRTRTRCGRNDSSPNAVRENKNDNFTKRNDVLCGPKKNHNIRPIASAPAYCAPYERIFPGLTWHVCRESCFGPKWIAAMTERPSSVTAREPREIFGRPSVRRRRQRPRRNAHGRRALLSCAGRSRSVRRLWPKSKRRRRFSRTRVETGRVVSGLSAPTCLRIVWKPASAGPRVDPVHPIDRIAFDFSSFPLTFQNDKTDRLTNDQTPRPELLVGVR